MKYIELELFKMRHKKIFLIFFLMLGVELLFIFSNYGRNENFIEMIPSPLAPAWEDLITGPAMFNGLFFPIMIAVMASRMCDLEHVGNTWKLLESNNQSRASLVMCKLVIICVAMLGAVLVQVVTIVLYGRSVHIVEALPSKTIVEFAIGTVMITFVVITIQLFLSLLIQNQLIPMAVGMIGALIGFISTLLPAGVRNLLIWGNYAELMVLGQETSDGNLQSTELVVRDINFLPIVILFGVGMIVFFILFRTFKNMGR